MCIKLNEGGVTIEQFESSRKEELGGDLWSRSSEVLGEIEAPETGSTRSCYRPCMGSVGEDIDISSCRPCKFFTLSSLLFFRMSSLTQASVCALVSPCLPDLLVQASWLRVCVQ